MQTYADGSKYDGNWVRGMKSGKGIYISCDGRTYDGDWQSDEQHGEGIETSKNG